MNTFVPPKYQADGFHCPYCQTYAKQNWYRPTLPYGLGFAELSVSICSRCDERAIWHKEKLVVPDSNTAPPPHPDMPEDVATDYNEAATILHKSPRGAAALLRLSLQKLMVDLGQTGKDINKDIGELVKLGLPPLIQRSLDIVRVIGNESVHPGQMDLKDDHETATTLFTLINFIIDDRISKPKQIEELYSKLPEGKREGIAVRDASN